MNVGMILRNRGDYFAAEPYLRTAMAGEALIGHTAFFILSLAVLCIYFFA